MEASLLSKIADSGNIAILVLLITDIGLLKLLAEVYRSMREDRQAQVDSMEKLSEVLTQVRLELAHIRQGDAR